MELDLILQKINHIFLTTYAWKIRTNFYIAYSIWQEFPWSRSGVCTQEWFNTKDLGNHQMDVLVDTWLTFKIFANVWK